jgi:hypothetical protein
MFETELQIEMTRYVELTKTWTGFHKYKVLCAWMGTLRMREMNDFLSRQAAEEAKAREAPP